jgi:CHAT domain-containing protein
LLRSALALAGANNFNGGNPNSDGIFTALEASQLNLQGTQLVVLSACETGLGDVANGEGIYGLRRAFTLAGSQSQLISLWKVDDDATQQLMLRYYDELLAGKGRSQAMYLTQRHFLNHPEYSHPYYWAAFIPSGNWQPLAK